MRAAYSSMTTRAVRQKLCRCYVLHSSALRNLQYCGVYKKNCSILRDMKTMNFKLKMINSYFRMKVTLSINMFSLYILFVFIEFINL